MKQVQAIVDASVAPVSAERDRLNRLAQALSAPIERPAAAATSGRTAARA
ncbi:MAG: hypothetical protein ACLPN5_08650 [Roseiarcus sp.]